MVCGQTDPFRTIIINGSMILLIVMHHDALDRKWLQTTVSIRVIITGRIHNVAMDTTWYRCVSDSKKEIKSWNKKAYTFSSNSLFYKGHIFPQDLAKFRSHKISIPQFRAQFTQAPSKQWYWGVIFQRNTITSISPISGIRDFARSGSVSPFIEYRVCSKWVLLTCFKMRSKFAGKMHERISASAVFPVKLECISTRQIWWLRRVP